TYPPSPRRSRKQEGDLPAEAEANAEGGRRGDEQRRPYAKGTVNELRIKDYHLVCTANWHSSDDEIPEAYSTKQEQSQALGEPRHLAPPRNRLDYFIPASPGRPAAALFV
ncbi:MAG: hypothetical protein ACXWUN_10465, partial [Allosphingosinicella sp.]